MPIKYSLENRVQRKTRVLSARAGSSRCMQCHSSPRPARFCRSRPSPPCPWVPAQEAGIPAHVRGWPSTRSRMQNPLLKLHCPQVWKGFSFSTREQQARWPSGCHSSPDADKTAPVGCLRGGHSNPSPAQLPPAPWQRAPRPRPPRARLISSLGPQAPGCRAAGWGARGRPRRGGPALSPSGGLSPLPPGHSSLPPGVGSTHPE